MAFSNGCSDSSASAVNFPCSQPVPAPLPADTPSTAIAHAFPGTGFFSSNASNNIDQSLALIDAYLACLGDVCNAAQGSILIGNGAGMDLVPLLQSIQDQLSAMLGDGEILLGSPTGAVASALCEEVENCLGQLLITNEMVLMNSANGLVGVDFCAKTFSCMNAASTDGQFFINIGGVVQAADFAGYVAQYAGATDCTAVIQCLVQATQAGEVLYNDGTNIIGVDLLTASDVIADPGFCNGVQGCIVPLLAPGQVLGNVGGVLAGVTPATSTTPFTCADAEACILALLSPGQVLGNVGGTLTGTTPSTGGGGTTFTCADVFDCLDANSANGQFFINQNGDVVATDFEAAVLAIAGNGGGGTGVTQFTGLTDTPANYTGAAGQTVQVNDAGTGIEFVENIPFENYAAVSLSGNQPITTDAGLVRIAFNNPLEQEGSVVPANSGESLQATEAGTYLITWSGSGFGTSTVNDIIGTRYSLVFSGGRVVPVEIDRNFYPNGTFSVPSGGSGAVTLAMSAGETVSLSALNSSNEAQDLAFVIGSATLGLFKLSV